MPLGANSSFHSSFFFFVIIMRSCRQYGILVCVWKLLMLMRHYVRGACALWVTCETHFNRRGCFFAISLEVLPSSLSLDVARVGGGKTVCCQRDSFIYLFSLILLYIFSLSSLKKNQGGPPFYWCFNYNPYYFDF